MPERTMTEAELFELLDPEHHATVKRWLDRGDGCAVYRNVAFDSSTFGHRQFVSFGGEQAQLQIPVPERMPDIGSAINWKYRLEALVRRSS